eukprot:TRINITY_DN20744_c0_g1_i1.p1 TRINITY_DN20744_c0_g1~~TRINITY_DN20744_c0_g1_i1.p1  ORF type:complete len:811 (-),score=155.95 TRINITY_DN20744_c0_g1_i1:13-2445(-)
MSSHAESPTVSVNRSVIASPQLHTAARAGAAAQGITGRNPKVQAFNRGKESAFSDALDFCKRGLNDLGGEILEEVRDELQQTSKAIRVEVADEIDLRQKRRDAKIETIVDKVEFMAAIMEEDAKQRLNGAASAADYAEANRKLAQRREEQIVQMTEQLSWITDRVQRLQKQVNVDDIVHQILGRMDLQRSFDLLTTSMVARLKEHQNESKAHNADISWTMEEVRKQLGRPVAVDLRGVTELLEDVKQGQRTVTEDLHRVAEKVEEHMQRQEGAASRMATEDLAAIPTLQEQAGHRGAMAGQHKHRIERLRDFWSQTEASTTGMSSQTDVDTSLAPTRGRRRSHSHGPRKSKSGKSPVLFKSATAIADAEAMKKKARSALMQPQYSVMDCYRDDGIAQAIARSKLFDNVTVCVVLLNAIWISIDMDLNDADVLSRAAPQFIVGEAAFAMYFVSEILIRFLAFQKRLNAFWDRWFVFDSFLVLNMLVETWIIPLIVWMIQSDSPNNVVDLSMLRMLRIIKILRISRVARLLRSVPELVIILRAIGFAARSVIIFFLLWVVIIYVFAVVLRQLTVETDVGRMYFSSVPVSMNTLLINGILADYAPLVHDLGRGSPVFWLVIVSFILLASVTVMYMLMGVLVQVVGHISAAEQEGMTAAFVSSILRSRMQSMGGIVESSLSRFEVQSILIQPEVCQNLASVHVDVEVLVDTLDLVFEDLERHGKTMTFEKMIDMVLNGRGANVATVRDTNELLRVLKGLINSSIGDMRQGMTEEFAMLNAAVNSLREEALARDALGGESSDESEGDENKVTEIE